MVLSEIPNQQIVVLGCPMMIFEWSRFSQLMSIHVTSNVLLRKLALFLQEYLEPPQARRCSGASIGVGEDGHDGVLGRDHLRGKQVAVKMAWFEMW